MTSTDIAAALVRTWTRMYTWRMTDDVREIRLGEIESDLWELRHDPGLRGVDPAVQMIVRLVAGVPSDLCWRAEQAALESEPLTPRAVMTAAVALLAAAVVIFPVWYARADSDRGTRIDECAGAFEAGSTSTTRADYRMQVITCAGRFFASR